MFRSLLAALLGASFSLGASLAMPYQAGVAQIAALDADLPAQAMNRAGFAGDRLV
jgi:hypothetical protein